MLPKTNALSIRPQGHVCELSGAPLTPLPPARPLPGMALAQGAPTPERAPRFGEGPPPNSVYTRSPDRARGPHPRPALLPNALLRKSVGSSCATAQPPCPAHPRPAAPSGGGSCDQALRELRHADITWPVGLMVKASASGAGDSRFESWAGHFALSQDAVLRIRRKRPKLARAVVRRVGFRDFIILKN